MRGGRRALDATNDVIDPFPALDLSEHPVPGEVRVLDVTRSELAQNLSNFVHKFRHASVTQVSRVQGVKVPDFYRALGQALGAKSHTPAGNDSSTRWAVVA